MAGSYADVPGPRMAYDLDGTVVVITDTSRLNPSTLSAGTKTNLNSETLPGQGQYATGNGYLTFIFPELRDIDGYLLYGTGQLGMTPGAAHTSTDTTNGVDGTWTSRVNPWANLGTTKGAMRSSITSVTWDGVKAVSFYGTNVGGWGPDWRIAHLYGAPSTGENPNSLRLWHPTLDQEITGAYFDWGDVARLTTVTRDFRIKNISATQTANLVSVSMTAPTDASPTTVSQHTFSTDGVTFTPTLSLGNIAPATITGVLNLKRVTPYNASLSLWWARILAVASSWT